MRVQSCVLSLALVALSGLSSPASAERRRCVSRAGIVAEVKPRPKGGEALWIDGAVAWPEVGARRPSEIVSPVVWNRKGDAVAFSARDEHGTRLVVVLWDDDLEPVSMTWAVPAGMPVRHVTWLGERRVGAGAKELDPKIVASWQATK